MTKTSNGIKPVVAIDLDGTLGPWHEHFRQFIQRYTGRLCPPDHVPTPGSCPLWQWNGTVPFYKWLGVSKGTYRQAKIAFRQGGFKRWMPAYPHASDLTCNVRKAGGEVWICTTRPYLRLDNIDPDTRHWLRRFRIQYDGVIFGENKYRDLVNIVGADAVVAVLDDLPEQVAKAGGLHLRPLLHAQPYNDSPAQPVGMHVPRVNLYDASSLLCGVVQEWKEKRHG
jgi:hypothetical protein